MTTRPALGKILRGLLHTEDETKVRQLNAKKNKHFGASRPGNKE
jgi:hypothetical protein